MATPLRRLWKSMVTGRETISTVLMGLSALVTTWCAFESTTWSGVSAVRFNEAAAARVESTRHELADLQALQVDLATFLGWLEALRTEVGPKEIASGESGPYVPDPKTLSGFLWSRMRPEFQPAVQAWVATRPLRTPGAPATPFAMKEYRRPHSELAIEYSQRTEDKGREGRETRRLADRYMMVTVISAMVVFFAGLAAKLALPTNGLGLLLLAWLAFFTCLALLLWMPVRIP